jgi:hypothetical protein
MATRQFFDNKIIKLPGAYATIVSGDQATPIATDYGKVLVIDTGANASGWANGSGIDGVSAYGKDAVYKFNDLGDYQSYLKGGILWKLAEALFKPDKKSGAVGVSEVLHVKAATTTQALLTFTATGGGANGGTFKVNPLDEGTGANGTLTSAHLDKGYAFKVTAGVIDTAKWVYSLYVGSWVGNHTDSISYNEIAKADSPEILLVSSPEFNNITELISWANTDSKFGRYFKLDPTSAVAGTGAVVIGDIPSGFQVAVGGTETYSLANLNLALDAVQDEVFTYIITDAWGGDEHDSSEISAINTFILSDSKYKRFLYFGGGDNVDEFDTTDGSIDIAEYFDSAYIHTVHGSTGLVSSSVAGGYRYYPSGYTAALMLGRIAGKQPQVPLTNKTLGIDKLYDTLNKKQQERALDAGIKVPVFSNSIGRIVCLQDVNSLQDNQRLYTPQGKSFSGSFMRIVEQINTELIVNSELSLLNDENGVTVNSLSAAKIKSFTETYLNTRLATANVDNLLLKFKDVTVIRNEDSWNVTYALSVNNEINKLFYTGFLIK